jgi:molybdopterin adenylyltransferase
MSNTTIPSRVYWPCPLINFELLMILVPWAIHTNPARQNTTPMMPRLHMWTPIWTERAVVTPVGTVASFTADKRSDTRSTIIAVAHQAKVLTVSESVHAGTRDDRSGDALVATLTAQDFQVIDRLTVPDGVAPVTDALMALVSGFGGLVVTTGGTGFSPSDLTPEATRTVLEREAPGLAEAMRSSSPLGGLSRGIAGTVGACLVVNVPGSPRGAVESIEAILDILPHALELLAGAHPH